MKMKLIIRKKGSIPMEEVQWILPAVRKLGRVVVATMVEEGTAEIEVDGQPFCTLEHREGDESVWV